MKGKAWVPLGIHKIQKSTTRRKGPERGGEIQSIGELLLLEKKKKKRKGEKTPTKNEV